MGSLAIVIQLIFSEAALIATAGAGKYNGVLRIVAIVMVLVLGIVGAYLMKKNSDDH